MNDALLTLTRDQELIVDQVCQSSANYFITGPAGTGKTVLLAAIYARMVKTMDPSLVGVVSPTGT